MFLIAILKLFPSELLENHEEMFPLYYIHSDEFGKFNLFPQQVTHQCVVEDLSLHFKPSNSEASASELLGNLE